MLQCLFIHSFQNFTTTAPRWYTTPWCSNLKTHTLQHHHQPTGRAGEMTASASAEWKLISGLCPLPLWALVRNGGVVCGCGGR